MSNALAVTSLSKQYGGRAVLDELALHVAPGETVAILGASGSGKSTLLSILATLESPDSGSVRVGATEVTTLTGAALANFRARHLGLVFQEHYLLPQLNVLENVLLPAQAIHAAPAAAATARTLLAELGLAGCDARLPAQLSGGERQRVAVARALVNHPGLLLCDEPTGHLDPRLARTAIELIRRTAASVGATVLLVTHQRELVEGFDRRMALVDGRLMPVA